MADRVGRLEDKVDKLTDLLSQVVGEIREIKGLRGPEEEPEATACKPEDYYSLYCILFDEWQRGNRRFVLKRLREMDVAELGTFIEAAKLPVEERTDKAVMVGEIKDVFNHLAAKAHAEQFTGLMCLLTQEWSHCNYPFVEGRLAELNTGQLKALAAANDLAVKKTAKRETVIKALTNLLEENRPATPPETGPRKTRNPQAEHFQYVHSVLVDEWSKGNVQYVNTQLRNQTVDRLQELIKANKLDIEGSEDKEALIEELKGLYEQLKAKTKNDQLGGLMCLLQAEWNCGNKAFVERRAAEFDEAKMRDLLEANGVKAPASGGKTALIKALKAHLKANAASAS